MIEKVKNIIMNADYKKTARFFVTFFTDCNFWSAERFQRSR